MIQGYKRIVLKISGDGFCSEGGYGIDPREVNSLSSQIAKVAKLGKQIAVVVGGGNILRGASFSEQGSVSRATADYMGMLGTVINALALQDALEQAGIETRVQTAIAMQEVAEPFIRRRCLRHLQKGRIVILAGGTGNPYVTTDTAAALRANEIGAQVLLKATKVDGVYTADPKVDKNAKRFEHLSYLEVLNRQLKAMDSTAISLCMENDLPIIVFNLKKEGNIEKAVRGDSIGTVICHQHQLKPA